MRRGRARAAAAVIALAALTLTAACGPGGAISADAAAQPVVAQPVAAQRVAAHTAQARGDTTAETPLAGRAALAARRTPITEAVARVSPAVVTVQTEATAPATTPFDAFFGGRPDRTTQGLGSGFIIRADGVIVTNAHVVAGATAVKVALRDGTTYPAKIVGVDETNDLAVLRIDAQHLSVAPLGVSDDLIIGEWAIAIGNPYGFFLGNTEPSVTVGVISGTGRNLVGQVEGAACTWT
jgi:serine protease Do